MADDIERKYMDLHREHALLKEAADMLRKERDELRNALIYLGMRTSRYGQWEELAINKFVNAALGKVSP